VFNWLLKFADNTKLFGKVQSELDSTCLQQDLQRLLDWSREWQIKFNVKQELSYRKQIARQLRTQYLSLRASIGLNITP